MRSSLQTYVRRFPVNMGKHRLVSLLWKPLVPASGPVDTELLNADLRLTCDLNQFIQRQIFYFGAFEPEACELWFRFAQRAAVVFDVGANVGLYSLLAAKANLRATIHAFEPTPAVVASFQQNVQLNDLENIALNPVAVGKTNGIASLHTCAGADGTNEGMNFVSENGAGDPNPEMAVPVVSLNHYCQTRGIEKIDLMKIDIEGGEYDALMGAESLIRRQAIKCIFIELAEWAANRNGNSTRDIKRFLVDAGYQLSQIQGRRLQPLSLEGTNNLGTAVAFTQDCTFIHSNGDN